MITTFKNTTSVGASRNLSVAGVLTVTVLLVLFMVFPVGRLFESLPLLTRVLAGEAMQWSLGLAVLAFVLLVERRDLSSLGVKPWHWETLGWGVLLGLAMFLCYPLVQFALKAMGLGLSQSGLDLQNIPFWTVMLLALRAGVVEELVFRGFLFERLAWLSGRVWVGALLSLLLFVLVHAKSWSFGHLIFVGVAGGLLTLLYVWRRNLVCNIIAHLLTDVLGLGLMRLATVQ